MPGLRVRRGGPPALAPLRGEMPDRRKVGGSLSVTEARSYPAVAVRSEDHPGPAARRMGDAGFEDMLGEFRLRGRGRLETGSVIGVWIEVGHERILFQPENGLVEKQYQAGEH